MILDPRDPQSSVGILRRRQFESWVIVAAVFLLLTGLFSWLASFLFESLVPTLFAAVLAGFIAYYTYVAWNREVRIRCRQCGESISCMTPWICGECEHENWDIFQFPFIRECEKCRLPPKSYICHHCDAHIFLSEDRDVSNPARRITTQGIETAKRAQSRASAEAKFEVEKRHLEQECEQKKQHKKIAHQDLLIAQIKAATKLAKNSATVAPIETTLNLYYEALKEWYGEETALEEAVRVFKLELAEKLKGNKRGLYRAYKKVDRWAEAVFAKLMENPTQAESGSKGG